MPALSIGGPNPTPEFVIQDQPPASQIAADQTTPALVINLTGTVLRVNDDAITSTEVIAPLRELFGQWIAEMPPQQFLEQVQRAITESAAAQLRNLLFYQHALRELEKNQNFDAALEAEMADKRKIFLAQFDGSPARAQAELTQAGTSLEDELEKLKRTLVTSYYEQTNLSAEKITRRQLIHYYRTHLKENYYQDPKVQFQLIDVQAQKYLPADGTSSPTEQQWAQARTRAAQAAQQAAQKIQNGAAFAEVVKEYSHGFRKNFDGLWRPIDPASLQEQYQPIIAALDKIEVGQCTGVVESQDRYFIARLISREEPLITPFSEAQAQIKEILRRQNQQKKLDQLLSDWLQNAYLGNMEKFINDTARAALLQLTQGKTEIIYS